MFELPEEDNQRPEDLLARRSNAACLSEEELEQYLHNRLSGVTRESIEEHLLYCQSCLDRVTEEEAFASSFRVAARRIEDETLRAAYAGVPQGPLAKLWNWIRRPAATLSLVFAGAAAVLILIALPSFRPGPPIDITLVAERGLASSLAAPAPAGRLLCLNLDTSGLPELPLRAELAGAGNQIFARSTATPAAGKIRWELGRSLESGTYWVRLYGPSPGILLREFALVVK